MVGDEITEADEAIFRQIISVGLTSGQISEIVSPPVSYPRQRHVLAVHWHPEYVPMELVIRRLGVMFPSLETSLIIPTQHNEIMCHCGYAGVEVDCYSKGFNQKVQLLLHFRQEKIVNAHILKNMLRHTYQYRSSQLLDFIHTLVTPNEHRLRLAARNTGAGSDIIAFVRAIVKKVGTLLDRHETEIPGIMIRNKLLRNFFDRLRPVYGDTVIDRAQAFLQAVKVIVKADFSLKHFYRASEIIEEARLHGAGIVVPHPEQYWPILLADYDVDGYEVWNPQSRRYTEFLISVLDKKNRCAGPSARRLMIFMGDDTHMGEKTLPANERNREKAEREVGYQPAWEDLNIHNALVAAGWNRQSVIREYALRIGG